MKSRDNLKINNKRLWESLLAMSKVGPGVAGGNNRQTLTDADGLGRKLFRDWCEESGCTVCVDQMGNMFATRQGTDAQALPVYVGSHLDTQPTGGRFDGVLGVLGGLEIIRTLNDLNINTRRSIVVVNWTNEEGTRFAPAMLGSGVFAGLHELQWAYDREDLDGAKFKDELERIGWLGLERVGERKIHSYFELHIEQGPVLENRELDIGVVTHGQGLAWLEFIVTGKESHTGSTPMPLRRNAGLAMARIIERANHIALLNQPNACSAVGQMEVFPNSRNVIPGKAMFTVDLRSPDLSVLNSMKAQLVSEARKICEEMAIEMEVEQIGGFEPVTFDEVCVGTVRRVAQELGYSHCDIISGAGHDACWINRVAPSAMIMCPCVDGLSHNEAENIHPEWASAGTEVLFHAVLETAEMIK